MALILKLFGNFISTNENTIIFMKKANDVCEDISKHIISINS